MIESPHPDLKYKNGRPRIKQLDGIFSLWPIKNNKEVAHYWTKIDPILGRDGLFRSGNFTWGEQDGEAYKSSLKHPSDNLESRQVVRECVYEALNTLVDQGYKLSPSQSLDFILFRRFKYGLKVRLSRYKFRKHRSSRQAIKK